MPAPNIFISSTFYDLRYIRENLRFFVRSLGHNPILSERGTIFFNPEQSAAEAAVAEVPNCQLFVLIIGGRYGTEMQGADQSVTNAEYQEAVRQKVPVFALVEQGTFSDYEVWRANAEREQNASEMMFPHADDQRIFAFIDEVKSQTSNNALVAFRDFGDIETYLRQQWAALLHSFLTTRNEENRVSETLSGLERINRRVEILSTQILESVGTKEAKLMAGMYDEMLGSVAVQNLAMLGLRPTPVDILRNEDFFDCARALNGLWKVAPEDDDELGPGVSTTHSVGEGTMSVGHSRRIQRDYEALRGALQKALDESTLSLSKLEERIGQTLEPEGT